MHTLKIEKREGGKAAQMRKAGLVPIAIQGKGTETVFASASEIEARRALGLSHGHKLMISVGGEKAFEVLVRGSDFDAAKGKLLNLSLQKISETDVVKMEVPIIADGEPESVTDGHSTISFPTPALEVRGVLSKIPDELHIDVSQLGNHDKILASDVALPDGVELQTSGDAVVATTSVNRAFVEADSVAADEASAAVAAPEETA